MIMAENFFSTKTEGIGGQIKRRYTDFVVEEMLNDGHICETKRFTENGTHQEEPLVVPKKPAGEEQLHLDLEKINKDTNFVIRELARYLQTSKKGLAMPDSKIKGP